MAWAYAKSARQPLQIRVRPTQQSCSITIVAPLSASDLRAAQSPGQPNPGATVRRIEQSHGKYIREAFLGPLIAVRPEGARTLHALGQCTAGARSRPEVGSSTPSPRPSSASPPAPPD